ncbi:MAG: aspartate/glutamate racemase family protein [Alphaproteobacteria bacterium]|nr:aspartate/glutamate racemase family protein [Alphaproteobacteria bacterium]
MSRKIGLIHATPLSIEPINSAFRALWPEAHPTNLLDDSLSRDVAAAGGLTPAMHRRFCDLAGYVAATGADAILYTCSAFGPCIETARRTVAIPTLKPNEAMIDEALDHARDRGGRIALVATFQPTIASMQAEFEEAARARGAALALATHVVPGNAMAALELGDTERHDRLIVEAVKAAGRADVVVLAQFSMARAAPRVAEVTRAKVLTTPASAIARLRHLLGA